MSKGKSENESKLASEIDSRSELKMQKKLKRKAEKAKKAELEIQSQLEETDENSPKSKDKKDKKNLKLKDKEGKALKNKNDSKKESRHSEISENGEEARNLDMPDAKDMEILLNDQPAIEKKENKTKKSKKDKNEDNGNEKKSKKRTAEDAVAETNSKKSKPADPTSTEIAAFLEENKLVVSDPLSEPLSPCLEFSHLTNKSGLEILSLLKSKYKTPTPIQSASWPYLLAGRDLIGIAETGSGKTMAFAVPAVDHLSKKVKEFKTKVGAVVVSPTRELALQIHESVEMLCKEVGLKSICLYGGVSKDEQRRASKNVAVIVATPGRLIDLLNERAVDISTATYVVLDEADRMLEKGFEEDIKTIITATNDKRQMVMFTATWPQSIQTLASSYLKTPATITVGDRDGGDLKANIRIEQIVEVMDPYQKEQRLLQVINEYQSKNKRDKILIFALYKKEASRVERLLNSRGLDIVAIHGDLSQAQRTHALEQFKSGRSSLLLATDVASRGLDIPEVKLVINLTFPLTAEDYVHRIGRTGRAGNSGKAITFFTEHEKHLSGALVNVLRSANQPVPEELLKFGGHTKKKEHSVYGAFYKDIDPTKKAKKIVFD